jgi:hypothetical protein
MPDRRSMVNDLVRIDPSKLRGLMQAVYVAKSLCSNESVDEIVTRFGGDNQLVDMWLSFLKHNHWLNYDGEKRRWLMSPRGKQYSQDLAEDSIATCQTPTVTLEDSID